MEVTLAAERVLGEQKLALTEHLLCTRCRSKLRAGKL